ncbi:segregation and condensation protein A [Aestuariivirga litoralis]|uniref:segregation and condensation protein A n=1 Tax=Aestuariivirga litoralis TaxID=2650924 RepID=UPI0018C584BE|nr:ScpA family protein [Aestuariivirga litoralis]MBG1231618.1 segregation/condensation protein A [Aestuariivirga litoralis]
MSENDLWADASSPERRELPPPEELVVDVGGFEGPLDLLLELARAHKIDLTQVSILALADQYLAFIDKAKILRIDVAADYLVMAAWLTYLKSRLLIPQPVSNDETAPQDMAARLAFRLQRLAAMREAYESLMKRPQLGVDTFARGAPQPLVVEVTKEYSDNLIDLLKAYASRRQRKMVRSSYTVKRQTTWSIKEARDAIQMMVGQMDDWGTFDHWLEHYLATSETRRSVRASSFTASLELARDGQIELRQDDAFRPIYLRRRKESSDSVGTS